MIKEIDYMRNQSTNEDLVFQIIDWNNYHEEDDDGISQFKIRLYGRTKDNRTVFVCIDDYKPFFYVQIPRKWRRQRDIKKFITILKSRVRKKDQDSLKEYKLVDRHIFWTFTNYKIYNFVKLVFHNHSGYRAYEYILRKKIRLGSLYRGAIKLKLFESNVEPMLRYMHIQDLEACGWVKIRGKKYRNFHENPTINDINIYSKWDNLETIKDESISKFVVASYDIECVSGDGSFPQPERSSDKIIQIGTTFNRYGEDKCFYKHIITLGTCDPIEGVDVESYNTEREVLLAWTRMIRKQNPDIMTGYNIFGFDYRYMYKRSLRLGCSRRFSKLCRLVDENTQFVEKQLSSSALGDNFLRYFNMRGRVQIDLMKVVQRDYKLTSYKLDNVAAHFIREKISDIKIEDNKTIISTGNIYGLEEDRYIKIYYNDGLSDNQFDNGKKYLITKLSKGTIEINDKVNPLIYKYIEKRYKIFWTQAKDDVPPKEIFRLQKGSSADRAKVAKYCIQDCVLVNKLMEKLQVLTNNIGMANVCHVPLSYIFLRGQGIKIFSLVAKKCRERKHLIPVIRRPYVPPGERKDNDEDGYEGATVFTPYKGVYFQPIPVLDFASLYPSSMIHRNISHECIVTNKELYGDLPEYYYYDITYYNKQDEPITCLYAKAKDGRMGIVPEILKDLLNARSLTKKKCATAKDPFKKKIFDGLQLAYKITANSLYGQTGARTSPIYYKEIAASTTATGRELLNAARLFAEYLFPSLIKPILLDDYDSYYEKIRNLFDNDIDSLLDNRTINKLKESNDYYYFRVFGEKKNLPKDEDFINKKLRHKCMDDFINYIYDEIYDILQDTTIKPLCVYGDSVAKDTPILLKYGKKIFIDKIENITDEWKSYDEFKPFDTNRTDKEQDNNLDYMAWTDQGWSKVKRVIRHKCKKKMYRIITDMGIVDVTEDHSLLDENGNILKPNESLIGTKLLKNEYKYKNIVNRYNPGKYYIIGFLIAYDNIDRKDKKLEHIILNDIIVNLVDGYIFYNNRYDLITEKLLNCSDKEKQSFIEGLNTIFDEKYILKDKIEASIVYAILKSLGKQPCISYQDGKIIIEQSNKDITNSVKKIIELGYTDDYVYDIETERGNFSAGIGDIIVKNTDSIFVNFDIKKDNKKLTDKKTLVNAIKIGVLCGEIINHILPSPQNLEYEKTFWPWISLSKKRYVGNLYERDPNKWYQKSMGIVLKRRDNAPIVKIVVGGIVDKILNEKDIKKAIRFTKETLKKIFEDKYSIDKFIITKTLRGEYKDRRRVVHAVLADRMGLRDPGNKPQSNDRIPYAYVVQKHKVKLQGDRVEHPDYIKEKNLKLDYLFYITNQIMKPSIQFLETMIKDPQKLFNRFILIETNKRKGLMPITRLLNKKKDEDNDKGISINNSLNLRTYKKRRQIRKRRKINDKEFKYDKNDGGFILEL